MRLIVGLGNPGIRYLWTRHNLGFWVLDRLGEQNRIRMDLRDFSSLLGQGFIDQEKVVLAKPLTYINLSGKAVKALIDGYKVGPKELIVCCDDVNLEVGRIRIRERGGSGGHKGLGSIIESIGTKEFVRLRIGIAKGPRESLADYVLSGFSRGQKATVKKAVVEASQAVEVILEEGIVAAMNRYNKSND